MSLFNLGAYTLHSGAETFWKIDCDALTDEDWDAAAAIIASRLPKFSSVEGVPQGGLKLAKAMEKHITPDANLTLICDDVLTTGNSMEKQRNDRASCIGTVLFSRATVWPYWVTPLFVVGGLWKI